MSFIPLHTEFYGEHVTIAFRSNPAEVSSACPNEPLIEVTSVLKRVHGGTQSVLARCSNGKLYIVKLNRNPQGPNVLANEWLGAKLLQHLQFSIPPFRYVFLDKLVIKKFPSLRFDFGANGLVPPSEGMHFASEFLESSEHVLRDDLSNSYEQLASNFGEFLGLYVFDVWANHQDFRQLIYRQNIKTRVCQALFIDNGHLFGGPVWKGLLERPRLLRPLLTADDGHALNHWVARIRQEIPGVLKDAIKTVPARWHEGDIKALSICLHARLLNLGALVQAELNAPDRSRRVIKLYDTDIKPYGS